MSILEAVSIPSQGGDGNLCWAAVTAGVCSFLDRRTISLADVAARCLDGCNGDLDDWHCNMEYEFGDAMDLYQHPVQRLLRVFTLDEIQNEIDSRQRPLVITLLIENSVNHSIVIKGIADGASVVVLDPLLPTPTDIQIGYDDLVAGTTLHGPWTETYPLL